MKFFRHLFGITKLDKEKNECVGENGSTEHSKGNQTIPEKWLKHVQRVDRNRMYRG
jgi:hypothetical protein